MWIRLLFFILVFLIAGCVKTETANCLNTDNIDSCAIIKYECEKRGWTYIYSDPLSNPHFRGFTCWCCE